MLNWVLSILVTKEVLTEAEAEFLSKKLVDNIHPHQFQDAHNLVKEFLAEYEKSK